MNKEKIREWLIAGYKKNAKNKRLQKELEIWDETVDETLNYIDQKEQKNRQTKINKPITFEQIQTWIKNQQFDKFYRSEEVQKKYDSEREEAIKRLKKDLRKTKVRNQAYRWVLRKNDYPYFFERGLEHWILWDISTMYSDPWRTLKKDWDSFKFKQFKEKDGWVVSWINPPQFRSINDIPHIHLVKKTKPS